MPHFLFSQCPTIDSVNNSLEILLVLITAVPHLISLLFLWSCHLKVLHGILSYQSLLLMLLRKYHPLDSAIGALPWPTPFRRPNIPHLPNKFVKEHKRTSTIGDPVLSAGILCLITLNDYCQDEHCSSPREILLYITCLWLLNKRSLSPSPIIVCGLCCCGSQTWVPLWSTGGTWVAKVFR